MINPKHFIQILLEKNVNFFTGVPDSLLKNFLKSISLFDELGKIKHVTTANEGLAVSLATGSYIGSKNIPLVYLQNSGLGNAINPLTSLTHRRVFKIPMLLLIGWRGEEGVLDEPQHEVMGNITRELLDLLEIDYFIIDKNSDYESILNTALAEAHKNSNPVALLVRSNAFESVEQENNNNSYDIEPKVALRKLLDAIDTDSLIFSTTGKLSRQIYQLRKEVGDTNTKVRDFLSVGSMGHILSIALGFALSNKKKKIYVIDGDGSALMHFGSFFIWKEYIKNLENLCYILFVNDSHDSVGGQPLSGGSKMNLFEIIPNLVSSLKKQDVLDIKSLKDLEKFDFSCRTIPKFMVIRVARNTNDLPRPSKRPDHYLKRLMEFIHDEQ